MDSRVPRLPTDCGGLFVSGGNMANFVCFLAARATRAGWDVRAEVIAASGRRFGSTHPQRRTRGFRRPPTSRPRHIVDPMDSD